MKTMVLFVTLAFSLTALANSPQFDNLSKSDVENIAREFSANFSHTGVSAPETDGLWGVEVGLVAGRSGSPKLKDVVQDSGGKGSDFQNLYHAGLMTRAHFPLDIFAEMTLLPQREISDVKIKSHSFELGWNAGSYFSLPLDLAVGINMSNSEISFKQTQPVASDISLKSKTQMAWIGVSKTFMFITPYAKFGVAKADSDLAATGSIFGYTSNQKENVDNSGGYFTAGANLQFAFFKFGAELTRVMGVNRASAKISADF